MDVILQHLQDRVKETNKIINDGSEIPQMLFEILKNQSVIMAALVEIKPIRNTYGD